jgi:hypothetical protein
MINNSIKHIKDERIIVLSCISCHKLIGTRENYYLVNLNGMKLNMCESCYDNEVSLC